MPTNHVVSALATFDAQQRLFYSTSPWNGPGIDAQVVIASQGAPCVPTCPPFHLVDTAGVNMPFITGLAFQPCRSTLEATDGTRIVTSSYQAPCSVLPVQECAGIVPGLRAGRPVHPAVDGDDERAAVLQRLGAGLPRDAAPAAR
ncbi:MAG: hypothetical protein IPM29_09835 [Planctomycetes bacterium]|nr:hypothetical protein [Planctomycetota bacterium]